MSTLIGSAHESYVRVRLVRFSDGTQVQSLSQLKLLIQTTDPKQTLLNRPKFPEYDSKTDRFCFETRTREGRQITISIYNDEKKINYVCKTSIEDLIRYADEVIREYRFSNKGRGWMSVELIVPKNYRQAQRIPDVKLRKHYGHEFVRKYYTTLPGFCAECQKVIWGFNIPGYRCQICSLVVHEQCINRVALCKQSNSSNSLSQVTKAHQFCHEPNFLPTFCDHDGRVIRPLRAWKCSECEMIVHSKCRSNVAQFCGTGHIAAQLYGDWKRQNATKTYDTYLLSGQILSNTTFVKDPTLLVNIYERLQQTNDKEQATQDLKSIRKEYESNEQSDENSVYYSRSSNLLHNLTFYGRLGRGMSGSVYRVKYSNHMYALKTIRKHRIFENDEYDCIRAERDVLILSRQCQFINKIHAVFHDLERVYFLLEYAPSGCFFHFLSRFGKYFNDECVQWFSGQILCALRFLHSKLIIHRDLKPENILLFENGRIKLADLGFCKQFRSKIETTRTFCGTAEYIAPEIYQGLRYNFSVDYWSLAVMIYEMRCMKTPFYHPDEREIRRKAIEGKFDLSNAISDELKEVLIGLLKTNPDERFGIEKLASSRFYLSSPYSLDEIEHGIAQCPFDRTIPVNSSVDKTRLSDLNEQDLCTTLTVDNDQFRNFSFMALTE